jgi:hypothetical protein
LASCIHASYARYLWKLLLLYTGFGYRVSLGTADFLVRHLFLRREPPPNIGVPLSGCEPPLSQQKFFDSGRFKKCRARKVQFFGGVLGLSTFPEQKEKYCCCARRDKLKWRLSSETLGNSYALEPLGRSQAVVVLWHTRDRRRHVARSPAGMSGPRSDYATIAALLAGKYEVEYLDIEWNAFLRDKAVSVDKARPSQGWNNNF